MKKVFNFILNKLGFKNKKFEIVLKFENERELFNYIASSMPYAIKPVKPAKTATVFPFSSYNAMNVCIKSIVDRLKLINTKSNEKKL